MISRNSRSSTCPMKPPNSFAKPLNTNQISNHYPSIPVRYNCRPPTTQPLNTNQISNRYPSIPCVIAVNPPPPLVEVTAKRGAKVPPPLFFVLFGLFLPSTPYCQKDPNKFIISILLFSSLHLKPCILCIVTL
nr:hypothetical protein Iba_chr13dCG3110 [Ipomoea batatas]